MARPDTGRYDELLKAVLSIAGEPVSPGVASELLPMWVVEPGNPGHAMHRRERIMQACKDIAAGGAGTYATGALSNAAGSNYALWVTEIRVSSNAQQVALVQIEEPAVTLGGGTVISYPRDTRLGDLSVTPPVRGVAGTLSWSNALVAAPGNACAQLRVSGAYVESVQTVPYFLAPDSTLRIGAGIANVELDVTLAWVEVPLNRFEQ